MSMEQCRLQRELADVAVDRPGGAIAVANCYPDGSSLLLEAILLTDGGVPSEDASCETLINFLHWVADGEAGDPRRRAMARTTFEDGVEFDAHDRLPIKICAEFYMTIAFRASGHHLNYFNTDYLFLHVCQRCSAAAGCCVAERLVQPATPEGLRNLLWEARGISKGLRMARG